MNQFVIDSDFGVFDADGNEILLRRVKEVHAIAQLKDVSRTDQFKQSLLTAAQVPYNAARNLVKDPVTAVSNVPKGMMKFMGRAGQSIKNIGKKDEGQSQDENKVEKMIGYTKTKRKIAISIGIDPQNERSSVHRLDRAIIRLGNLLSGPNITGRAKDYEFFVRRIA